MESTITTPHGLPAMAELRRAAAIAAAEENLADARRRVAALFRRARAAYRVGAFAVRPSTAILDEFLQHPSCPTLGAQAALDALRAAPLAVWFADPR